MYPHPWDQILVELCLTWSWATGLNSPPASASQSVGLQVWANLPCLLGLVGSVYNCLRNVVPSQQISYCGVGISSDINYSSAHFVLVPTLTFAVLLTFFIPFLCFVTVLLVGFSISHVSKVYVRAHFVQSRASWIMVTTTQWVLNPNPETTSGIFLYNVVFLKFPS